MTILEKHIRSLILENGYITVDTFLSIVIPFYYHNADSLGQSGDFITAPELSQIFGEIIGLHFADYWLRNVSNKRFNIVEFGPGRGYLMADFLRATKKVHGFHHAINKIIMFESSAKLIREQKRLLSDYAELCIWTDDLELLRKETEITQSFFIANEFFDALPIKQFQNINGTLYENCLIIDTNNQLEIKPLIKCGNAPHHIPNHSIVEIITTASLYTDIIKESVLKNHGSAIIIDYVYLDKPFLSSLQAIKQHQRVGCLEQIGLADITSLVDFNYLAERLKDDAIEINITTQKSFLEFNGINARADILINKYGADSHTVKTAVNILTDDNKMGALFKVLSLYSK